MFSICCYLAAKHITSPIYIKASAAMGHAIAQQDCKLIYGGSSQGLMGHLASAALKHGGQVIGVLPHHLVEQEKPMDNLSQLIYTDSMQERKATMRALSNAFVALPGGLGTLEELFETWVEVQLGLMDKPIALLNTNGYFDKLLDFLADSAEQNFIHPKRLQNLIVEQEPELLIEKLIN